MPEYNDLMQQIFQQYGLAGLLLAFLVLGPIFTLMRTKNMQSQTEAKAHELLSEFARQERQRADRLEDRLNTALAKLDSAEDEVVQLRQRLAENQRELEAVAGLRGQIEQLAHRVAELESQLIAKDQQLVDQAQHITDLEHSLQEEQGEQIKN